MAPAEVPISSGWRQSSRGALDIPIGRVAVVADPFENVLVLVDVSKDRYATDHDGNVTAVN